MNENEQLRPSEMDDQSAFETEVIEDHHRPAPATEIAPILPELSNEPLSGDLNKPLQPIAELEWEPPAEAQPRQLNPLVVCQLAASVPNWPTQISSVDGAVQLYLDFKPTDAMESILATLAVGLTNATMDGLDRANRDGLNPQVRQTELKLGHKGSAAVVDVLKMLETHRRAGDRKINVENVNVNEGGQAIVGNVRTGRSSEDDGE
jgi:hypothetical protein